MFDILSYIIKVLITIIVNGSLLFIATAITSGLTFLIDHFLFNEDDEDYEQEF